MIEARGLERHYGFRNVAQMEWLKLRSVRSTRWTLLVFAAGLIGLAILAMTRRHWATMSAADRASFDPVNDSYAGLAIGQLAVGVLGVLTVTSEFSSGMIRAISAVAGALFVLPLILVPLGTSVQNAAGQFMPTLIAENSLTAVKPVAHSLSHSLSPGVGFALLCAYAAAALAAGGWALARRDA